MSQGDPHLWWKLDPEGKAMVLAVLIADQEDLAEANKRSRRGKKSVPPPLTSDLCSIRGVEVVG